MNFFIKLLIFLIFVFESTLALAQSWPVGVEREVDPGTYMSVYAVENGWRVWSVETKEGLKCKAVKSAKGRPHPIPLGSRDTLYQGTPFLSVQQESRYDGTSYRILYVWNAEHFGKRKVKIRRKGEKFWDEYDTPLIDMGKYGEETVDISVSSWEYPAILVGYSEENAIFDLTGIEQAKRLIATCSAKK